MALIDDPQAWILRLFEMEEREGRGAPCRRLPEGTRPDGVPLDVDERVFGIYKDAYFFTPKALIEKRRKGYRRIPWATIVNCSSHHGGGSKIATLTLTDGSRIRVRVGDFGDGSWGGRISQLFHQMIQKWGSRATLGPPPMTIEAFCAAAEDEYSLAPNLDPHPSLEEMRSILEDLRDRDDVTDVWLHIVEIEDGAPVAEGVIVRGTDPDINLEPFREKLNGDATMDAPDEIVRGLPDAETLTAKMIFWD